MRPRVVPRGEALSGARWVKVILALVVLGLGAALVIWSPGRPDPARCGEGLVALGPRCCGQGQRLGEGGRCEGRSLGCGARLQPSGDGCLPDEVRVRVAGGRLAVGPSDWEAQGVIEARVLEVSPFWIDRFEASEDRLRRCAAAGACEARAQVPGGDGGRAAAVGLVHAEALCRWAGGRLPTDDEWTFAAMGSSARRYPWGDTGAVCRRAAFGLARGPCAEGAVGPDTVGSRPAGDSPEGIADLAGNLAEWTLPPGAGARRRGGSFRTELAAELRGWNGAGPDDDGATGVRCAYDSPP